MESKPRRRNRYLGRDECSIECVRQLGGHCTGASGTARRNNGRAPRRHRRAPPPGLRPRAAADPKSNAPPAAANETRGDCPRRRALAELIFSTRSRKTRLIHSRAGQGDKQSGPECGELRGDVIQEIPVANSQSKVRIRVTPQGVVTIELDEGEGRVRSIGTVYCGRATRSDLPRDAASRRFYQRGSTGNPAAGQIHIATPELVPQPRRVSSRAQPDGTSRRSHRASQRVR